MFRIDNLLQIYIVVVVWPSRDLNETVWCPSGCGRFLASVDELFTHFMKIFTHWSGIAPRKVQCNRVSCCFNVVSITLQVCSKQILNKSFKYAVVDSNLRHVYPS